MAMISQGRTESIWTPRGKRGAETQNILSTVGIFVVGKIRMVTQDCEEVKFSAPNHDAKVDLQSGLASVQISLTTSAPETRIHYRGSRARRLNGPRQGRQLRPAKGDSDNTVRQTKNRASCCITSAKGYSNRKGLTFQASTVSSSMEKQAKGRPWREKSHERCTFPPPLQPPREKEERLQVSTSASAQIGKGTFRKGGV